MCFIAFGCIGLEFWFQHPPNNFCSDVGIINIAKITRGVNLTDKLRVDFRTVLRVEYIYLKANKKKKKLEANNLNRNYSIIYHKVIPEQVLMRHNDDQTKKFIVSVNVQLR